MAQKREVLVLCELANQQLQEGEFAEAVTLFERARQIDDQDCELHEGLGAAYFMLENYDQCIAHFTIATELQPRRGAAFINLGAVYNRIGDYKKAVEVLRHGLKMEIRSAEGYYNLGIAYRRLKQLALAVPAYREAIRLAPEMTAAYLNLANVFLDMGNYQQAIVHFKQALEREPNFERAQRGLERAKQAQAASKSSTNPFGRLVDEEVSAPSSNVSQRDLTPAQRRADRNALRQICQKGRSSAHSLLEHLRDRLGPELKTLDRTVVQESKSSGALENAGEELKPTVETYYALVRSLSSAVNALRQHEAEMNAL